jgi:hypothetical protein
MWSKAVIPETKVEKPNPKPQKPAASPKPEKAQAPVSKPQTKKLAAAEKPAAKGQSLKEQGGDFMKEIGVIITAANNGEPYFTEDEKEGARQIIKDTSIVILLK